MLSAERLEHSYAGRTVLSVEELRLEAGTAVALVGPNGSGKSTLLRLLAFLERPASGRILLDGRPVRTAADHRRARRRVTLVEQAPYLFPGSAEDNVRYALSLHEVPHAEARRRARAALARLEAESFALRQARDLSDGEQQRVALARALVLEPSVLLLDEPTGAADRAAAARLHRILEEERSRGTVVCLASHQIEDAYRWCDRVIGLAHGRTDAIVPENLFRTILGGGAGPKIARIGPLDVHVVTDAAGPATLVIPADEIVVSRAPLHSSARNQFVGRVVRLSEHGTSQVALTVDVGVDLTARVTRSAVEDLGLGPGTEVVLSVKALAVRVY